MCYTTDKTQKWPCQSMLRNERSLRFSLIALLSVGLLCYDAQAVTAANAYVTVSSSTYGVEDIVPVGADFYVTTRNVGKPSFRADISVRANSPYYLVIPANGRMNLETKTCFPDGFMS